MWNILMSVYSIQKKKKGEKKKNTWVLSLVLYDHDFPKFQISMGIHPVW